jgi:hypothetical protein
MSNQFKSENSTTYNQQKMKESMQSKRVEMEKQIQEKISEGKKLDGTIIQFMNYLEGLVHACGGENKLAFLEVSSNMVQAETRVPVTANLYQFLPEGDDNPRFHKTVTQILVSLDVVERVRWVPRERTAIILVQLRGD